MLVALLPVLPTPLSPTAWAGWLTGYSFRQEITITQPNANNTETPGTNYQIPILVDSGSNDGSEFMFVTMEYFPTLIGTAGYQGIAQDGDYVFTIDSVDPDGATNNCWIRKWQISTRTLVASRQNCLADAGGGLAGWHGFSDGNILTDGGNLYIAVMESSAPADDSAVMIYDQDLNYVSHTILTGDDGLEGIDYKDGYFWTCYWKHDYIRKYNTSWALQATYAVADPDNPGDGFQSIVWKDDGTDNVLVHQHGGEINEFHWGGAGFSLVREIQIEGHFNGGVTPPDMMYTEDKGVRWLTPMAKGDESTYSYWMGSECQYSGAGVGSDSRIYRFELTNGLDYGTVNLPIVYLDDNCDNFPTDIRFTDDDETTQLDYYLDPKEGTGTRRLFWVEVADNLASSYGDLGTINIYYGKAGDASAGNGSNCFLGWDDFDYQYNVGDPPKAARGWTTFGADTIDIQNNPDGPGLTMRINETGDAAGSGLINDASYSDYPVAVHYRGYQTTTYYSVSSKYYVAPAVFTSIQKGGPGATTVEWWDGAANQDFEPTSTAFIGVNTWYKTREYANDNIPGGLDLLLNLTSPTWGMYFYNFYGDYRAARLGDEFKWLITGASGASAIDIYIDDFFVRKAIYYEPFLRVGEAAPPANVNTMYATAIEETTVTLNGNITVTEPATGNMTDRGFVWGTTSIADPVGNVTPAASGYDLWWTESGNFGNGTFSHNVDSLSPGTCYYFRAYGLNTYGHNYGSELYFVTKPMPPVGLTATAGNDTTVTLTWTMGQGADYIIIRHSVVSTPSDWGDGNLTYQGTGISYVHEDLLPGYTYYYIAFSRVTTCGETKHSDSGDTASAYLGAADARLQVYTANVYRDYNENRDMLVVAGYVNTAPPYFDTHDVSRYFHLRLLDTDLTTVLHTVTVKQWGMRPGAIYVSADQAAGLTEGAAYGVQIWGTFPGGPQDTYVLQPEDWGPRDLTYLDRWCLAFAKRMEEFDGVDYTVLSSDGRELLNVPGGTLFRIGVPLLKEKRSSLESPLFYATSETFEIEDDEMVDAHAGVSDTMLGPDIEAAVDAAGAELGLSGEQVSSFGFWGMVLAVFAAAASLAAGSRVAAGVFAVMGMALGVYLAVIPSGILFSILMMAAILYILHNLPART